MITDSKASSMLRECEDDFQKRAKLIIKNNNQKSSESKQDKNSEEDLERIEAILGRFRFLRQFHSLVLHIWKRDDLSECSALINGCHETLTLMQKTASLGVQRNNNELGEHSFDL